MRNTIVKIKDTTLSVDYVIERDFINSDRGEKMINVPFIKSVYIQNRNVMNLLSANLVSEIQEYLTN